MKETLSKKQSPEHVQVIFDRSGLLVRCVKYSISKSCNKNFQ